jgi:hypothetical protein
MTPGRAGAAAAVTLALLVPAPASADPLHGPPDHRLDNTLEPTFANQYAETAAFAGDLDGDGDDELAVGVPGWDDGVHWGAVLVHAGSPDGPVDEPVLVTNPTGAVAFAHSVSPGGDVDGDGHDDLLVSAWRAAYLVPGTPTGPGEPVALPLPTQPDDRITAVGVGDVDGDGFDDVLVGDPQHDGTARNQGRALLLHGSAVGLGPEPDVLTGPAQRGARFGGGVSAAGDVDADGLADLLVAAPGWRREGRPREGRGYVFLGADGGLGPAIWHADPADYRRGGHLGFGRILAPAGDVDGDGYDDVVFALPYPRERIWVYRGSATGTRGAPVVRHEGGPDAYGFGYAVAGVGDLDGDGHDEVVVGAPQANVDRVSEGRTYLFRGRPGGLRERALTRDPTSRAWAEFGDVVAGGGDVDGDGSPDLAVAAPDYRFGSGRRGRVYVWR